jgi:hypothetical protein
MLFCYRLQKARHLDTLLLGEGARRFGGRWNPPGVGGVPGVFAGEGGAGGVDGIKNQKLRVPACFVNSSKLDLQTMSLYWYWKSKPNPKWEF